MSGNQTSEGLPCFPATQGDAKTAHAKIAYILLKEKLQISSLQHVLMDTNKTDGQKLLKEII